MRVTQSMLAMNTLRHISQGYERLGKLQDQFASGKKITRPSQDPVVAMNGMRYRSQVVEVKQFQRNIGEAYNWLDNADSALDKTTAALHRIRDLAVQASNDTYEHTQRANIAKEIDQLLAHVVEMANTKSNGKYIFNGTDTMTRPVSMDDIEQLIDMDFAEISQYDANGELEELEIGYLGKTFKYDSTSTPPLLVFNNGNETITINDINATPPTIEFNDGNGSKEIEQQDLIISDRRALSTNEEKVSVELLKGVTLDVNITPSNVFNTALFGDIKRLSNLLKDPETEHEDITKAMDVFDKHIDNFVSERAELGARVNRAEMIEERQYELEVISERIKSNNEDADMERVIIDLTTQEIVHRASLAAGARIIQPTLMDFLR